jgi:mannosyl-3-phosphoglycerate phosphatase
MTAVVVFTDLDGTLLDHHSYEFAPAEPALQRLRTLGFPLVLTTSKTLSEALALNQALDNREAVIVENGTAAGFPAERSAALPPRYAAARVGDYVIVRFAPAYAALRDFIEGERGAHGFRLEGFGDMDTGTVMRHTGLDAAAAGRARQRLSSEPFLWHDSGPRLREFTAHARAAGLRITRGGRFHHLLGHASKASAIDKVQPLLFDAEPVVRVVLGDSENDREMLEQADIAVVVRRHDGSHLDCHGRQRTLRTEEPGPAGWNAAILRILDELG